MLGRYRQVAGFRWSASRGAISRGSVALQEALLHTGPILASSRRLGAYTCPMVSNEVYERARLSRDARFDGQFFVGVKTTG
ncbi:MAG: hypothetical protein KAJ57_11915, partial [Woeseiaceae bacterium]|nr:hypothetical protein [Woeseiaceae bacterium]